jgi:pimeloyl-ACP methyl ester carboxylesterase
MPRMRSMMAMIGLLLLCPLDLWYVPARADELAAQTARTDLKAGAPNYAKAASWAALPNTRDAADVAPANNPLTEAQSAAAVDVFYIHPTTFRSTTVWNQDIGDKAANDWTDISVIERQASAFNACCKIYAPRYRQAAISAVLNPKRGMQAYAFAYEDVKRAFAYFIAHYNAGRPFMIVGHSQGAFHAIRLLEEAVDGTALKHRMVAAYVIGIGVPTGTFGKALKSIGPCRKPNDTGCVVSWNTFGRNADPDLAAASPAIAINQAQYAARFGAETSKEILCTNPLTFDLDLPDAPASANLGSLPGAPAAGPLPAVKPGLIGAGCRNGLLYADVPVDPDFVLTIFPGDVLHMHDIDFFYQNIRANAVLRARTFLSAHRAVKKTL